MRPVRLPRPRRRALHLRPRRAIPGRLARSATHEAPASPAENAPPRPLRPRVPRPPVQPVTAPPRSRSSRPSASTPIRSRAKRPRPSPPPTSLHRRPPPSQLRSQPRRCLRPRLPYLQAFQRPHVARKCFRTCRPLAMNPSRVHHSLRQRVPRKRPKSRSCRQLKPNALPSVGAMAPTTRTRGRNQTSGPRFGRSDAMRSRSNRESKSRFSLAIKSPSSLVNHVAIKATNSGRRNRVMRHRLVPSKSQHRQAVLSVG